MTKYRRGVFDGDAINRLRAIFAKGCADFEAQLIEMKPREQPQRRVQPLAAQRRLRRPP